LAIELPQIARCLKIYDPNSLQLKVSIPIKYRELFYNPNNYAKIIGFEKDSRFTFNLQETIKQIPEGQAAFESIFKLSKNNYQPIIGQAYWVTIQVPLQHKTFIVPKNAVYNNNVVYRVIDDRLVSTNIEVIADNFTALESPAKLISSQNLTTDDIILANYIPNAHNGLKVITYE
jgi:hypothetical protein